MKLTFQISEIEKINEREKNILLSLVAYYVKNFYIFQYNNFFQNAYKIQINILYQYPYIFITDNKLYLNARIDINHLISSLLYFFKVKNFEQVINTLLKEKIKGQKNYEKMLTKISVNVFSKMNLFTKGDEDG